MNEKAKNEINLMVDALVNTGIVSRILLFGSYARGEETPSSDVDLCVLTQTKPKSNVELIANFRKSVRGVRTMPMDLLAYNQDNFYFHAERPTSFEHEIAKTGVLLYGQP
jgi:predicted nucleotidyltransferase